jgi:Ca2+-binding RTX toxin-like protein
VAGGEGEDTVDGGDGADTIFGSQGGRSDGQADFLNGGDGADEIHASSGDYSSGGAGADTFFLEDIQTGDPVARICDFDRSEDALILIYDPIQHPDPVITIVTSGSSSDATVLLDGIPVAEVLGGAGMQAGDLRLQPS